MCENIYKKVIIIRRNIKIEAHNITTKIITKTKKQKQKGNNKNIKHECVKTKAKTSSFKINHKL